MISEFSLSDKRDRWRSPFNKEALERYGNFRNRNLMSALCLAGKRDAWWRDVWQRHAVWDALDRILGLHRPDHSFSAPAIDWALPLTEPQATRTIAKFLRAGPNPLREKRIAAFLGALGVKDIKVEQLCDCEILDEKKKIDLQFKWNGTDGHSSIVVIEAKFDHFLTEGQLKKIRKDAQDLHKSSMGEFDYIILGLDIKAKRGMKGKQRNIWRFVSWRDLWIRFEKARPEEHDDNMRIFLNTLWHRICR